MSGRPPHSISSRVILNISVSCSAPPPSMRSFHHHAAVAFLPLLSRPDNQDGFRNCAVCACAFRHGTRRPETGGGGLNRDKPSVNGRMSLLGRPRKTRARPSGSEKNLRAGAVQSRTEGAMSTTLPPNPQTGDQPFVTRLILLLHVVEKAAALTHHLQQATARMVVLRVTLEMFGEVGDALGEDRDLHLGGAGVAVLAGKFLDELSLALRRNRHR